MRGSLVEDYSAVTVAGSQWARPLAPMTACPSCADRRKPPALISPQRRGGVSALWLFWKTVDASALSCFHGQTARRTQLISRLTALCILCVTTVWHDRGSERRRQDATWWVAWRGRRPTVGATDAALLCISSLKSCSFFAQFRKRKEKKQG